MADDDLDLDAMLDSALDEGFANPNAAQAGGEDDGEIDLDAMLDEAMVASVLDEGDGSAAAEKSRYVVARIAVYRIGCLHSGYSREFDFPHLCGDNTLQQQ